MDDPLNFYATTSGTSFGRHQVGGSRSAGGATAAAGKKPVRAARDDEFAVQKKSTGYRTNQRAYVTYTPDMDDADGCPHERVETQEVFKAQSKRDFVDSQAAAAAAKYMANPSRRKPVSTGFVKDRPQTLPSAAQVREVTGGQPMASENHSHFGVKNMHPVATESPSAKIKVEGKGAAKGSGWTANTNWEPIAQTPPANISAMNRQAPQDDVATESGKAYPIWKINDAGNTAIKPSQRAANTRHENGYTKGTHSRPCFLPSGAEIQKTQGKPGLNPAATDKLRRTNPAEFLNSTIDPTGKLSSTNASFPPPPLQPHNQDLPTARPLPIGKKTATGFTNNQSWYRPPPPKEAADDDEKERFTTSYRKEVAGASNWTVTQSAQSKRAARAPDNNFSRNIRVHKFNNSTGAIS